MRCKVLAACLAVCSIMEFPLAASAQETEPRDAFARAYTLYTQGQLAEAKELFTGASDLKFVLADYSLYYLALIASKDGRWDESRRLLSRLRRRYPQSIWYYPALLQKAKDDIAEKNYAEAAGALLALRSAKEAKTEIVQEALYLLAQTHAAQENSALAYAEYRDLREQFPTSRWAAAARKEQAQLRSKFPELFGFDTMESLAEEANRLTREGAFSDAEVLYKKLINNVTERELRLSYLDKLAAVDMAAGKRDEAIPLFNVIAREFPDSREAANALYQIGRILWNRHDNARALEYLKTVLQQYPTSAYTDRAEYAAGDIQEFFGQRDEALNSYNKLINEFPGSPLRPDALWRVAWLYYRAGEWRAAADGFAALAAQAKDSGSRIAALYWQARSAQNAGNYDAAKDLYVQIIKTGTESYYQDLATRSLQRMGILVEEVTAASPAPAEGPDPPLTPPVAFHLGRARELSTISLNRMAVVELDEVARAKPQPRLRPILMREYFRNQAYGRSLAMANQLPDSDGERDFYRFPLAFWDMVRRYAEQRGLDPYLVLALIRQESLFDSRAQSSAAALGLMQLLPSTAKRIAKQIGMSPPSRENLFQPEVNLALGTQYLKDLLERYSNNWFKAIAAYNAGESAVDRWEKEIATSDIEEFVERIPYVETRGYVKLVMRNHRIYKKLYDGQK